MTAAPDGEEHRLHVRHDGGEVTILSPGPEPFTFGRGEKRNLRIGTCRASDGGLHVSRQVGRVEWSEGSWFVRNDSDSKPFDVLVRGVAHSLAPHAQDAEGASFVIGPDPVQLRIADPARETPHLIELVPGWRAPVRLAPVVDDPDEETTAPTDPSKFDLRARRVLAVKFLSRPVPGHAIASNDVVVERVNALLRPGEEPVSAAVVANLVLRCRKYLVRRGVPDLHDPDALGVRLLHWGVIPPGDRVLLRGSRFAGDPGAAVRAAGPADGGLVTGILGRLSRLDPAGEALAAPLMRRGNQTSDLVALIAETLLPLGASLVAADAGAALVLPPSRDRRVVTALLHDVERRLGTELNPLCGALFGSRDVMPAYRLCWLGVDDAERGRGLGSALLGALTARCDREDVPAVATLVVPGPVHARCEAAGFRRTSRVEVVHGPAMQVLWREPRPS